MLGYELPSQYRALGPTDPSESENSKRTDSEKGKLFVWDAPTCPQNGSCRICPRAFGDDPGVPGCGRDDGDEDQNRQLERVFARQQGVCQYRKDDGWR